MRAPVTLALFRPMNGSQHIPAHINHMTARGRSIAYTRAAKIYVPFTAERLSFSIVYTHVHNCNKYNMNMGSRGITPVKKHRAICSGITVDILCQLHLTTMHFTFCTQV